VIASGDVSYHGAMRRGLLGVWAIVAGLVPTACGNLEHALDEQSRSPEVIEARQVLDALARGDVDVIQSRFDESLRAQDPTNALKLAAAEFPKTTATRVRVVSFGAHTVTFVGRDSKTVTTTVTFESNYPTANLVTEIVFRSVNGSDRRIVGFHTRPLPAPLEVLNALTFSGKGAIHYLFLIVMFAVAVVTLVALRLWVQRRATIRRRRWWLAGILLGPFKIALNWTTGALALQALTVQLFSLSYGRGGLDAPMVLTFSIPAGAIAFLIVHRRGARPAPGQLVEAATTPGQETGK
jgi:hypothetical protein